MELVDTVDEASKPSFGVIGPGRLGSVLARELRALGVS